MKKIILLLALIFFNLSIFAQLNLQWVKSFTDSQSSVEIMTENNSSELHVLLKAGKSYKILTINKKTGTITNTIPVSGGYYLSFTQMKASPGGAIYLMGSYKKHFKVGDYQHQNPTGLPESFLIKIQPGQNITAQDVLFLEKITLSQLEVLPGEDLVVGGRFRHKATILGQTLEAQLDDVFLMRLTPSFQLKWINKYGSSGDNKLTALCLTPQGKIISAASFSHQMDIDTDIFQLEKGNHNGSAVWETDLDGNTGWKKFFSGHKFGKLQTTNIAASEQRIFLANEFSQQSLFNKQVIASMGNLDILLISMDHQGQDLQLHHHLKSPMQISISGIQANNNTAYASGSFTKRLHWKDNMIYAAGDTAGYSLKPDLFLMTYDITDASSNLRHYGDPQSDQSHSLLLHNNMLFLGGSFAQQLTFSDNTLQQKNQQFNGFLTAFNLQQGNTNQGNITQNEPEKHSPIPDKKPEKEELSIPEDTLDGKSQPPIEETEPTEPTQDTAVTSTGGNADFWISDIGYYGFTAQWNSVPSASSYLLKVSHNPDLSPVVEEFQNIQAEPPFEKKIEELFSGVQYYAGLYANINDREQFIAKIPVKTKCKIDTFFFKQMEDHVLFHIIDCHGTILCMGAYRNGTTMMLGKCADDKAKIKDKEGKTITTVNPPKIPVNDEPLKCDSNEIFISFTTTTADGISKKDSICIPIIKDSLITYTDSCTERASDIEKIICLSKEGVHEVQTRIDEIEEINNKVLTTALKKDLKEDDEEYKELKQMSERAELLRTESDSLRELYEARIHAIAQKRTITIDVINNGAGFTFGPKATIFKARWSKYDDVFKTPGPQVLVEFNISNFSKEKIKSWGGYRFKTVSSVTMDFIDQLGNKPYPQHSLMLSPCIQVRGTLITNIAVVDQLETLKSLAFSAPTYKLYNSNLWQECDPDFLHPEEERQQIIDSLQSGQYTGAELNTILFNMLISVISLDYPGIMITDLDFYLWACDQLSDPYFEIFHNRSTALDFTRMIRQKTLKGSTLYHSYKTYRLLNDIMKISEAARESITKALEN